MDTIDPMNTPKVDHGESKSGSGAGSSRRVARGVHGVLQGGDSPPRSNMSARQSTGLMKTWPDAAPQIPNCLALADGAPGALLPR